MTVFNFTIYAHNLSVDASLASMFSLLPVWVRARVTDNVLCFSLCIFMYDEVVLLYQCFEAENVLFFSEGKLCR